MLDQLLARLPCRTSRGVVVTQHMPVGFTAALATRFNRISSMPVKESENGDIIEKGRIIISKAGVHTIISQVCHGQGMHCR